MYYLMHHIECDCNFGYFFSFWDDLLGTTHPVYRDRFACGREAVELVVGTLAE